MTGNEYQVLAARTINKTLTDEGVRQHALFGLTSEVGELNGIFQKRLQHNEADFSDEEYNHMLKEVGDILWFVAEFCTANDWDLEDVMTVNIAKLKARYPDGFDVEKSLHRKEGDI